MITQAQHYGGALGHTLKAGITIHPDLYRVYRFDVAGGEGTMVDATELRVGAYVIVVALTGSTAIKDTGGSTIATVLVNTLAVIRLLDNSTADGVWTVQAYPLNAVRTFGSTTRPGSIDTVAAANLRSTIAEPACSIWSLEQCSGPSIGSTLYSRQDFSAYDTKFIHLSSDPAGVYREVNDNPTVAGPIDTRDLLSFVDEGPWDQCGPYATPCDIGSFAPSSIIASGITGVSVCTVNNATYPFDTQSNSSSGNYDTCYSQWLGAHGSTIFHIFNNSSTETVAIKVNSVTQLTLQPGTAAWVLTSGSGLLGADDFNTVVAGHQRSWVADADGLQVNTDTEDVEGTQSVTSTGAACGDATLAI